MCAWCGCLVLVGRLPLLLVFYYAMWTPVGLLRQPGMRCLRTPTAQIVGCNRCHGPYTHLHAPSSLPVPISGCLECRHVQLAAMSWGRP